ncbi:2-oxo acid dehydrogenase subunit E2 [Pseudonocardia abyssalis]|nr:2-oxo acid dehydrogenase subunit E2 [Pseudonocardia abyssalis]
MPSLGADMAEGTVVEWLIGPGDEVRRGDVVATVDTEKALIDVECFESGTVDRLLVDVGTKVPVGAPLALIATAAPGGPPPAGPRPSGAPAPAEPPPPAAPPQPAEPPPPTAPPQPAAPPGTGPPRPRTAPHPAGRSPLTRRRAAAAGLDLAALPGTGPDGEVTRADVDQALRSGPPHRPRISPYARRLARERGLDPTALAAGTTGPLRARDVVAAPAAPVAPAPPPPRPRSVTAALMARSKREIPHYYLSTEIELGAALERLRRHNLAIPVADRVLPAAQLLHAVVRAAGAVPELNGHWIEDRFVPGDGVHLGVAVALRGGGLSVPVLHHADALDLDALMAALLGAAGRARSGRLRSSEADGATLTVTNLGELGVDAVTGVIFPPQVALVGFGAVRPRAWPEGDALVVRPVVTATLSGDHRATDGATGARLLHEIDRQLHRPEDTA